MTRVVVVDAAAPDPAAIAEAAAVIRSGGLVAFPTETVYGLGASALDSAALARIFSAKERPTSDPLIAHIADSAAIDLLAAAIPAMAHELARRFWPGPLTLVLRRRPAIPAALSAGRDTVAVRMPAHPVARALIAAAGVPIAAPSANRFSRPSPTTAAHVLADLRGRIDLLLDGGPTPIGVESSVVDLTADPPVLLRPGGIAAEELRTLLPNLAYAPRYVAAGDSAPAPGMLLRHYAPDAPLTLFRGPRGAALARIRGEVGRDVAAGRRAGVLVYDEDAADLSDLPALRAALGPARDPDRVAMRLFAAMRELEAGGVERIYARDAAAEGLGLAIRDRLVRAAEGRVIEV